MKEFTCLHCGRVGYGNAGKKYCSRRCTVAYHRAKQRAEESCVFNQGILCVEKDNCAACGWNPAVEEARKEEAMRRMENDYIP